MSTIPLGGPPSRALSQPCLMKLRRVIGAALVLDCRAGARGLSEAIDCRGAA